MENLKNENELNDAIEDMLLKFFQRSGFDLDKLKNHRDLTLGEKFSFLLKKMKDTNFIEGKDYFKESGDIYVQYYFVSEVFKLSEIFEKIKDRNIFKNLYNIYESLNDDEKSFLYFLKRHDISYPFKFEDFNGVLDLWHSFVGDCKKLSAEEMDELMENEGKYSQFKHYLPKLKIKRLHGDLNKLGQFINQNTDKEHLLFSFSNGREKRIHLRLTGKNGVYDKVEQVFFYQDVIINDNNYLTEQEYELYKKI